MDPDFKVGSARSQAWHLHTPFLDPMDHILSPPVTRQQWWTNSNSPLVLNLDLQSGFSHMRVLLSVRLTAI